MPFARILSILLLLVCSVSFASASRLDSLLNVLKASKDDTAKVSLLHKIFMEQRRKDPLKALEYAEEARALSHRLSFPKGEANALGNIGSVFWLRGEMDKAKQAHDTAFAIYTKLGDKKGIASSNNGRGLVAWKTGNHAEAVQYFISSLRIFEEMGSRKDVARAYANIAIVYMEQKKYDQALEHFNKSLPVFKEINDPAVATVYNNMANIYSQRKEFDRAEEYLLLAIKLYEESKDRFSLAMAYSNFGNVLYDQGENEKALSYYMKSMKMHEENNDKKGTAVIYNNIGSLYERMGDLDKAVFYQQRALNESRELGDKNAIMYALEGLARAYERQKNYALALKTHKQYAQVRDSLFNLESSRQIADMSAKYETEKKEKEIAILTKDKELQQMNIEFQEARINKQAYLLYMVGGGLFLTLGMAFVIYYSYRQKHEANRLLNEKNMLIEEQHRDIKDSINYAKKIQLAILPPREQISKALPEHFILYHPKDVVSGDFYAFAERDGKVIIAAADCTGHGVPGAFMSMIGHDQLNHIIIERGITQPAEILHELNKGIRMALKQSDTAESKDGMDIALCCIDVKSGVLEYSGAHRPLFLFSDGFREVAADKVAIGGHTPEDYRYSSHTFELKKGDSFYIFSDGFADQFGGEKGKKFMKSRFRDLLESVNYQPMEQQGRALEETLLAWRGRLDQVDDVLVIGVRM